MKAEGIHVVEINLNLPATCYYLHWMPRSTENETGRVHERLHIARNIAEELEWRVLADGVWGEPVEIHVLFETTTANLDHGLPVLLSSAPRHRLRLVQAGNTVRQMLHHMRGHDGGTQGPPSTSTAQMPDTHFGMFMGERAWAERMLDILSQEEPAQGAVTRRRPSLTEIARGCPDTRQAVAEAYRTESFSLKDIAEFFDMHFSEVSAIVNTTMMNNGNRVL